MDEVDGIVLFGLKALGCNIDDDVKTVRQLKAANVYEAVVLSLASIEETAGQKYPSSLPQNLSASVNVCSELANVIKGLGVRGDVGYHCILYPNEADTRRILLFLEEKRTKAPTGGTSDPQGGDFFQTALANELTSLQKENWKPLFTGPPKVARYAHYTHFEAEPLRTSFVPGAKNPKNKPLEDWIRDHLPYITAQPEKRQNVVPSLLEFNCATYTEAQEREQEWNTLGLESGLNPAEYRRRKKQKIHKAMSEHIHAAIGSSATGSVFGSYATFVQDLLASEEGSRRRTKAAIGMTKGTRFTHQVDFREKEELVVNKAENLTNQLEELENLETQLSEAHNDFERMQKEMEEYASSIRQLEASIIAEQGKRETLEEEYRIKKRTYDLLPDAANNIKLLRDISQQSSQRLIELAKEWEKHRAPLLETYRQLKDRKAKEKLDGTQPKLDRIRELREQMKILVAEIQKKDEKYNQLLEIFNSLPKDMNRSVYTRRILEIVKNVKKQKIDIDKILIDTRNLKKEISQVYDTLHNRSFPATSELVFKDALKEPTLKQAYKDLVAMHEKFQALASSVEEQGTTKNTVLNLEVKIEQTMQRTESLDVTRVSEDLKRVKLENQGLITKLKEAQSS